MIIKIATITSASVVASSVAGRNITQNMSPTEVTELGVNLLIVLFIIFLFCFGYFLWKRREMKW